MIKIFNTQSKKKEEFSPGEPGKVKMYVCGPTVYDFLHVGNFRGPVFFNLVRNWLEKSGFDVTFVYNYTDVEDRIINRSLKEKRPAAEITETFIREFEEDFKSLKLKPHSHNPRVTEFMGEIVKYIEKLIQKGHAYQAGGDVYFSVEKFPEYGKLSRKNLEDLMAGTRVEPDPRKRHEADFALWKAAKPGEPTWDSPWGPGRPGWHIECSVMSQTLLGDTIDIHGGGIDLVFPHHENEVAQSEACTGHAFVRYWMHNNMLELGHHKMSKSLGNIKTFRSFRTEYDPEIYKFMILQSHYRSIIDFGETQVERAVGSVARFYSSLAYAKGLLGQDLPLAPVPESFSKLISESEDKIKESLDDDFNTPEVLARWFEVMRAFNNLARKPGRMTPEMKAVAEVYYPWLRGQGALMALFQMEPDSYLKSVDDLLLKKKGVERSRVDQMVVERSRARAEKNFKRADEMREQLVALGISIQDSATGTSWEVSKT